jgi:uncharacterized protein YigE (DUF2233 family)
MNAALKPYTVIGVTTGKDCARVHLHVMAHTPEEAVCEAINELNSLGPLQGKSLVTVLNAVIYHTPVHLLGAGVFEGHLDNPSASQGVALSGHERPHVMVPSCMAMLKRFTVVTVDPASCQVEFHHQEHANANLAECNPSLDFFLIGGVLKGHAIPVLVHQTTPRAWPTSRDQRVMALANRYSLDHLQHLGYHQAACM